MPTVHSNATEQEQLQKESHRYLDTIMTKSLHRSFATSLFVSYLLFVPKMAGDHGNSMSNLLSFMENLKKRFSCVHLQDSKMESMCGNSNDVYMASSNQQENGMLYLADT